MFFSCWFGYSCLSFRSCFTYRYAFACSWLSPLLACHTLHTPHLTQFCTAIAYLPCLLAAPFLLNTHFMHLVCSPFITCFLLVTYACFPLNIRLGPTFLLIFCMMFCGSLPNSATIHMAPLCEHLMAQDNFCTSAQAATSLALCSVALCLPLPLFAYVFYVNSLWHGASLCPRLGSHISGTLLCGSLPSSATLHMPILFELFMAWGIIVSPLRQPHLSGHIILWPLSNLTIHKLFYVNI